MNKALNDAYRLVHDEQHDAALELLARYLDTSPEADLREIVEAFVSAIEAEREHGS